MERHGLVRGRGVRAPPASGSRHPPPDHGCGRRRARVAHRSTGPTPAGDIRRPPREVRPMLREELQIPSRDTLVAAAIRQMARDLRAHERTSAARRRRGDRAHHDAGCATGSGAARRRPRSPAPAGSTSRTCSTRSAGDDAARRAFRACSAAGAGSARPLRLLAPRRVVASLRLLPTRPAPSCCARSRPAPPRPTGTAFLRSLVRHVAEALDAEIAFAAEVEEGAWARARVLAAHGRDGVELDEGYGFAHPGHAVRAGGDRDVVAIPTGTRGGVPARRLRRPPRARGLPGDRRPRQRRRAGSATSA